VGVLAGSAVLGALAWAAHRHLSHAVCDLGVRVLDRPSPRTLLLEARHPVFIRELVALNEEHCKVTSDWDALDDLEREYERWSRTR